MVSTSHTLSRLVRDVQEHMKRGASFLVRTSPKESARNIIDHVALVVIRAFPSPPFTALTLSIAPLRVVSTPECEIGSYFENKVSLERLMAAVEGRVLIHIPCDG